MGEHISETFRFVERLRRGCEETRLQCQRQREMIAEQRRLLGELDERLAGLAGCAGQRPGPGTEPGGDFSGGE